MVHNIIYLFYCFFFLFVLYVLTEVNFIFYYLSLKTSFILSLCWLCPLPHKHVTRIFLLQPLCEKMYIAKYIRGMHMHTHTEKINKLCLLIHHLAEARQFRKCIYKSVNWIWTLIFSSLIFCLLNFVKVKCM